MSTPHTRYVHHHGTIIGRVQQTTADGQRTYVAALCPQQPNAEWSVVWTSTVPMGAHHGAHAYAPTAVLHAYVAEVSR